MTPQPEAALDVAGRREQRRARQQELARQQLLDAAEEVFGAKGFHDTTLKEVAGLAEYSVGSVYSFFANKDDLFLSIWLRRGADFTPGIEAAVAAAADALDALHRIVDFEVGFFRAHPHFGRLYLRSAGTTVLSPEIPRSPELSGNLQRVISLQADVMARGQRERSIRPGDPWAMARVLSGLVQAFQGIDPEVVGGSSAGRMSLDELHAIVDGAFRVP
ncbi:TetR/AcrR family transcriptional regulator [Rhabdothermincola salaria]|uniref:TetR/AcrR family transcriptional regulator n=1 Tax=Rhabdothermincola salaria TaxID=2903142 RepID=UPI001E3207E4|nr:TetR/AcrR family transcriptional regulator [Rhabdothermincola salaria]